jgi:hypothetical protein
VNLLFIASVWANSSKAKFQMLNQIYIFFYSPRGLNNASVCFSCIYAYREIKVCVFGFTIFVGTRSFHKDNLDNWGPFDCSHKGSKNKRVCIYLVCTHVRNNESLLSR